MRPDKDSWAMALAVVTAQRATCARRSVGAVLLNECGHVIATGYNGVAAGQPHCNEVVEQGTDYEDWGGGVKAPTKFIKVMPHACSGACSTSGTNLDGCEAIHAEQNALIQCRDAYSIHTAYVTASPCMTCVKLLMNTSCKRIVFLEEYPHSSSKELWERSGREWIKLDFKYTFAFDKSGV